MPNKILDDEMDHVPHKETQGTQKTQEKPIHTLTPKEETENKTYFSENTLPSIKKQQERKSGVMERIGDKIVTS